MIHLFVCSSPIQLINIINIIKELDHNDVKNLYLLDHNDTLAKSYEKILKSSLFKSISLVKTKQYNQAKSQTNIFTRIVSNSFVKTFSSHYFKKITNDDLKYDKFWISYVDRSSVLFYTELKKKK